jgi:structural maintenance of chromosome 3 (chondroitin sulfate proteoglycan 6)
MRTAADDAEEDAAGEVKTTEVSLDKRSKPNLSAFHGVQVRVKFSGSGQQFDMQQLSGGQKALVALALIFAIQRCDPAPFYLFDEIDQALDANYRAGVARLIQKQVESEDAPAQFITTTFRNELVSVANKCYGIALLNKVSNIYPLEKQEAMNFVQNLMTEEGVGAVSTVPGYQERDENFDNNYNDEDGPEVDDNDDEEEEEVEEEDERLAEIDKDLADIDIGKARAAASSSSRREVDPFSDDEEDDDDIDLFEISKGKKGKATKGKGKSKTVKRKSRA